MAPKEKAKELAKEFWNVILIGDQEDFTLDRTRQCAIIAVEQILKVKPSKYWREVKSELEKMLTWEYKRLEFKEAAKNGDRWIPSSEQFPEHEEVVLVTVLNWRMEPEVFPAVWVNSHSFEVMDWEEYERLEGVDYAPEGWYTIDVDSFMNIVEEEVVAWMPLPKPPKKQ